jgi:hypothetical protein
MQKQYTVTLTADQAFYLEIALGGQIIKDCTNGRTDRLDTAQELARVLNPIARQIVAEYEENVVQEFVTNMDQEISKILE